MAKPSSPRGTGRQRVLDAALLLFARKGVSATSLQDSASELGVTKAAVYFQFHTKDEIVLAVLEPFLSQLEGAVAAAQAQPDADAQREHMLKALIDLAIDNAAVAAVLQHDITVARVTAADPRVRDIGQAVTAVLTGPQPSAGLRVAAALLGQSLVVLRADPALADIDDAALRIELLACTRRLLEYDS